MPNEIKIKTANRDPLSNRLYGITKGYAFSLDKIIDSTLSSMVLIAQRNLQERLKVASFKTLNNIKAKATQSGKTVLLEYQMPDSFKMLNRGRDRNELHKNNSGDVNIIKKWLKDKRKVFGYEEKSWHGSSPTQKDSMGRTRAGVRKGTRYRNMKGQFASDQEIAEMITGKIEKFGTRSSRYKFVGLSKTRRKRKDGSYVEVNKPIYQTYPTLVSTAISNEVKMYLKKRILELEEVSTSINIGTGKFDINENEIIKNYKNIWNTDLEKIDKVTDEIVKLLRSEFNFVRYDDLKRHKLTNRKKVYRTPGGYIMASTAIRKKASRRIYTDVLRIFKDNGLISRLPKEFSPEVNDLILKMLARINIKELKIIAKMSGASVKKPDESAVSTGSDATLTFDYLRKQNNGLTDNQIIRKYAKSAAHLNQLRKLLRQYKAKNTGSQRSKDWAKYFDEAFKILRGIR